MAAKKVGTLIKEARVEAGLTQEQLAKKVKGVSAADIGKVERGEKDLTNEEYKLVAKALGITQKSLLDAPKNVKKSASSSKTSSSKTPATAGTSMKVTPTEKRLVQLYREADGDTKKRAMSILRGDTTEASDILQSVASNLLGNLVK